MSTVSVAILSEHPNGSSWPPSNLVSDIHTSCNKPLDLVNRFLISHLDLQCGRLGNKMLETNPVEKDLGVLK